MVYRLVPLHLENNKHDLGKHVQARKQNARAEKEITVHMYAFAIFEEDRDVIGGFCVVTTLIWRKHDAAGQDDGYREKDRRKKQKGDKNTVRSDEVRNKQRKRVRGFFERARRIIQSKWR